MNFACRSANMLMRARAPTYVYVNINININHIFLPSPYRLVWEPNQPDPEIRILKYGS